MLNMFICLLSTINYCIYYNIKIYINYNHMYNKYYLFVINYI